MFYSFYQPVILQYFFTLPEMATAVLTAVQKMFPSCKGQRQFLALDLTISLVVRLTEGDFTEFATSFFSFLADMIRSDNSVLVMSVLGMFEDPDSLQFLQTYSLYVSYYLWDAVTDALKHWSPEVRMKARVAFEHVRRITKGRQRASLPATMCPLPEDGQRTFNNWMELARITASENPEFTDESVLAEMRAHLVHTREQKENSKFMKRGDLVVLAPLRSGHLPSSPAWPGSVPRSMARTALEPFDSHPVTGDPVITF
jgi:hypothetical protein